MKDHRLNVIKSFYVKFERKIPALVEDFCRYYAGLRNKTATVVYYYDATALGSNYAVNEQYFLFVVGHCRFRSFAEKEHLLELRTDGSDAFDTLYIGCEKFPYHDNFSIAVSGVLELFQQWGKSY